MNNFCKFCTAGSVEEIKKCGDKYCPYWKYRRYNMKWQRKKKKEVILAFSYDGCIA